MSDERTHEASTAIGEAAPRLISLPISPYNDFARWCLERAGVAYREERQALVLHVFASRRAGGKGTTPVLIADGEAVGDSSEIAEWADRHALPERRLYPEGDAGQEARRMVVRFANELGFEARKVIWTHLIDDVELACRYWSPGVSPRSLRAQPWALRAMKPIVKRSLGLKRDSAEAAPQRVREIFDEVARSLADGRPHLMGDRITALDLSFAAMSSPAVLPPVGYPVPVPHVEDFPEQIAATIRELRAHPAGEYALRLYRDERAAKTL
jgi:glutathione S-transferase